MPVASSPPTKSSQVVASGCPMRPPASMEAHEAAESEVPSADLPSPMRNDRQAAIYKNQFGTACDRFLLVEDNLVGKALGWLRNYWATAMAVAVQSRRVLHQVPPTGSNATRWCNVAPFTLECFYMRWNDCASTDWSKFDHPLAP